MDEIDAIIQDSDQPVRVVPVVTSTAISSLASHVVASQAAVNVNVAQSKPAGDRKNEKKQQKKKKKKKNSKNEPFNTSFDTTSDNLPLINTNTNLNPFDASDNFDRLGEGMMEAAENPFADYGKNEKSSDDGSDEYL